MTINSQSIFISRLGSEKTSGFQIKEKKSCLKTLAWTEIAEGYLNPVTKRL